MKRIRLRSLLLMFSLLILVSSSIIAQAPTSEIIFIHEGDLWSYVIESGATIQQTTWGYNSDIALSPDGTKVVYSSVASEAVEGLEAGTAFNIAQNIWLYDLTTREFSRIANQDGASSDFGGIMRSPAQWSPDSTMLAWIELNSFDEGASLKIYDFTTEQITTWVQPVSLGFQDGGTIFLPDDLIWGDMLSWTIFTFGVEAVYGGGAIVAEFYDNTGKISDVPLFSYDYDTLLDATRWHWVEHNGVSMFAFYGDNNGWRLIDPTTGDYFWLVNPPILQRMDSTGYGAVWTPNGWLSYLSDDFSMTVLGYDGEHDVLLAPDGESLAFVDEGTLFSWRDGVGVSRLLNDDSVFWQITEAVWTPSIWRTDGMAELSSPPIIPTATPNAG